jgi:Cd2+/Zn2+-exporting ATPase
VALPEEKDNARTWVHVAVDGVYAGAVCIADRVKDGSAQAVQELKTMGIATAMLTGDQVGTAEQVGRELGIDRVHARLLPEEKLTALRAIRAEFGPVMFVGDGINDAPVLSGADVGAAMGAGADAAIEAADVVFMTSQPQAMPQALQIARRTQQIAWQNVIFALAIKLGVMVLGLLGYASMWAAVFADTGVAMLCILNSIRMLYKK